MPAESLRPLKPIVMRMHSPNKREIKGVYLNPNQIYFPKSLSPRFSKSHTGTGWQARAICGWHGFRGPVWIPRQQ